jgi:putative peptidoglycan lipid II flippase
LRKGFGKNFVTLCLARGGGALLSIVLFFLLAKTLGAGSTSDAFFMARRFTTALTASIERTTALVLVPAVVGTVAAHEAGRRSGPLLRPVNLALLLCFLGALAIAAMAPWIVHVLAPGFEEERHGLASHLLRILAFMLPLSMAASIGVSFLNAYRHFAIPELATHLPRVALIGTLIGMTAVQVDALAWALLAGSAAVVLVLTPSVARIFLDLRRRTAEAARAPAGPETEPRSQRLGRRLGLTSLSQLQLQGTSWIDAAFASLIGIGALSMLEYAQRLVGLLPSLLSNSLLTVAYTELSGAAMADDLGRFRRNLVWTIRANLFLILPTAVVLAGTADLLVGLVFQRGAFDAATAAETTRTIRFMMPGLAVNAVMSATMAALIVDTSLPSFRIVSTAIAVMLASRVLIFLFTVERFELAGLVLGSAAAMMLGLVTLFAFLLHYWKGLFVWQDAAALGGIVLCAAISAAALEGVRVFMSDYLPGGFAGRSAMLVLSSGAAGIAYLAAAALFRLREVELLGDRLLRRRPRRAVA